MAEGLEPLIAEDLLLTRELIAERNPQALPRVAQQLNTRYPVRAVALAVNC